MEPKEKSIQELENDFWPDQNEYPTGLVGKDDPIGGGVISCNHTKKKG